MNQSFNQWLAGVIDGDGCFQLSKKGYACLEITMDIRDKHCLYQIKQKFGGSVKIKSDINYLRYRLHHKKGLLELINSINGFIRNPTRLIQLKQICDKYGMNLLYAEPLTYNNGWLAGMIDSDGSIYLNLQSDQVFISIGQKNKLLLDPLVPLYGGSIYMQKQTEAFKWVVYRKKEILALLEYFRHAPLRSAKKNRVFLISKYFLLKDLKAHLAAPNSILGKEWKLFLKNWESYSS
uniref:Putative LAGLIDADG homing endonuclease n=1 Tax=Closterium baillyanum TaxID=1416941 RepID=U5YGM0_9VIRI|nr:putative LAGLIDADG homing endonuclease [Closterium baillyanum]AGZ90275.1 putative LAGLIDADG homing endonuclease [Closterium baillyanum]